jgi:hypothetical protein
LLDDQPQPLTPLNAGLQAQQRQRLHSRVFECGALPQEHGRHLFGRRPRFDA